MGLLKRFFKNDDKVVGLCAFKKKETKPLSFTPQFTAPKLAYAAKYNKNFFIN